MILKKGMPWSVMGTRVYGRDLLPLEIFLSKHTWGSRGIIGVPMDVDMRDERMFGEAVNIWA